MLHELSEQTKRVIDAIALVLMGVAGSLTLANVALVLSCISTTLAIAWHITRFIDRKRGREVAE